MENIFKIEKGKLQLLIEKGENKEGVSFIGISNWTLNNVSKINRVLSLSLLY